MISPEAPITYALDEKYRLLLKGVESITDYAIFMLDANGYIMTWNEGAKRLKQYMPAEIIGKHFSTFYTEDAKAIHHPEEELKLARANGQYEEEGWRVRKDGSLFWANVVITAIYEDGNLLGFTKVTRDLTERKEADERLRQSEERFRHLLEGVKDYAIFMLDADGLISTWNEGASRLKGYDADEVIGKHFSIFYPDELLYQRLPEVELKIAKEIGRFEEEGWRKRKDGTLFWASVILTALYNKKNELMGFTKITRDLTQQKQMIDELRHAKEVAEATNKELETFSYSVSHDLRAPLRTVDGFVQLVLEDKADILDEDAKHYLGKVSGAAQQMGHLIDGLLQLSRLNRAEIEKEAVSLTTLVKEALNTMMRYEPDRNVELKIQEGLIAQADLVLMQAVLQNLLSNAWKFTRHKKPAVIEFGSDVILGKETFFIRDNGVGFDMKYADKLFGAFQRLHSVSEFPGNGIGLATVQRIIGRHGGAIWADSVPNEGTTFYFALQEG